MKEELDIVEKRLYCHESMELILKNFAKRSSIREISNFVNIFSIAKKSGGNITYILQDTIQIISEKLKTEHEIQVILSGKKYEANIMKIIPFFFLFYIEISNPNYFCSLYNNPFGMMIMSVCLVVYFVSLILINKIIKIEV